MRPNPLQLDLQPRAGERIQRAERLIQQQQARPVDETARDCRPLRHPAGELMRICVGEAIQADQGDVSRDGLPFGAFAN